MAASAESEEVRLAVAKIIDPMAWKAWEIDHAIETRRKVSLAKAQEILELVTRT